jgi:enoyl-CoA hydratase
MMDYDRYKALTVEKQGKTALVTLNKPESMNAFDVELHFELEDVLDDLAKDNEVNAIVLTGAGKAFSAGGNLKMMQEALKDKSLPRILMNRAYRLINNILALEKPIIAAVNGHAVGLGATIALFCDVIFASENARFSDPHVSVGVVAGDGGCVIWPLLIGVARAKQYLMTGDPIGAKEAEQIGLINKAVPQDQVLPMAMAFAQRLANGPIKAIGWTKMSINEMLRNQVNLVLRTSLATEFLCFESADHAEAVNAFVEKRVPKFTGE